MPLLQLCFKHSECSTSSNKCYHFKHAKGSYKTENTIWFLILGNDSLYFAIIPLTPSATRTIMLGSPNDSPCFGQKRKITIHLSLFTGTIHCYCSLRNFAYLRGAVPYIQSKCFLCLVQDFFLRERLPLRAFLCENILAYTSYFLLTLPTFSTKLVTSKAL